MSQFSQIITHVSPGEPVVAASAVRTDTRRQHLLYDFSVERGGGEVSYKL